MTAIKPIYQICVSGAAKGDSVEEGQRLAFAAGVAIAKAGHTLMTGATTGLPDYAARGAKSVGGKSVGISPAASKIEHVRKYRLPVCCYDTILYTGLHYVGRDSLLVASSDAIVSIGGRLGTLHEFTIAMEMDIPIGLLMGAGGVGDEIHSILKAAGKDEDNPSTIFDDNPTRLIDRLTKRLNVINKDYLDIYHESSGCAYCRPQSLKKR